MAYSYDQVFAADPSNPSNVAQDAAITIFAPGDETMTPLTITDPDGQPLANPIITNANGFGSAFAHETLDRVAWAGGSFTGFFTSYEGIKDEAVAARTAADEAAANAAAAESRTVTTAEVDGSGRLILTKADATTVDAGAVIGPVGPKGDQGLPGVNGVDNDSAVAEYVNNTGSATRVALNATYAPALVNGKAPVRKGDLTFNVMDYGAVGDYNSTTGVGTDDTAAFQAAVDAAHNSLWGVVYVPPTKKFKIAGTITLDARTTTLFGYRATLYYTGTGLMFQIKGGGTISNQGGIAMQGLRLIGPGKTSTATAIQMNTDDALTTLSYVAGHPFENLEITDFGVGLKQANRAWGNTLRSSSILRCGTGFLVPSGLTSSQGERLAFDDCIIAENTVGVDIQGPHVDLVLNNCSLDYNSVAYKSNNHVVMNGGHVEVNGAGAAGSLWAGAYGHMQHTASTARSMFFGVRFVIGQMHTEPFEPYNGGDDLTDELSLDAFLGWGCTFSWGSVAQWGTFVSRTPGFPYKRLVNESNGRRGARRGIFRNIGIPDDSNGRRPIYGASLVPSRSATVAIPTAVVSVSGGTAVTRGADILADQTGSNPVSAITLTAPSDAAGTNSLNVNTRVYVGPDDAGKMFLAEALADLTITGADSQRVVYINFYAQNDVALMAAETGMSLTTMATGTTNGVSIIPTYSQMKVPVGTHYVNIQMQFTKIRNGDVFKIYHPQVNVV